MISDRVPLTYDHSDLSRSIAERFVRVALYNPDAPAVIDGETTLSYGELCTWASEVGRYVLNHAPDAAHIATLFGLRHTYVGATFGALLAGKCYTPLDHRASVTDLAVQLDDAEAGLILTDRQQLAYARAAARGKIPVVDVETLRDDHGYLEPVRLGPDAPAILLYTSGSTGKPKGVLQRQLGSVYSGWIQAQQFNIKFDDHFAQIYHPSAGGGVSDLFGSILNGCSLWLFDPLENSLQALADWLRSSRITLLHPPVTLFRALTDSLGSSETFPDLRAVILAGQAVRKDDVQRFSRNFPPSCMLINRLAGTETGGLLTRYVIDPASEITTETVPVGYVNKKVVISIRDEEGQVAPAGEAGEMYVHSPFIALGYWRRPELDRERFIADPLNPGQMVVRTGDLARMHSDGLIELLGRMDFMVKIRGYRVELAAVESALRQLADVREAVVVASPGADAEPRLVAYVVTRDSAQKQPDILRMELRSRLPDYAIPSAFVFLDALPLTTSGKPDRRALVERQIAGIRPDLSTPYRPPETPIQALIAGIWADVLGLDRIGIDDNFLDLGGNSILAARILARINQAMGVDLPFRHLVDNGTPASLAAAISHSPESDAQSSLLSQLLDEIEAVADPDNKNRYSQSQ
ncbi:MAG: non-ribosomal peptide synthetase [Caldilineales bacterium]|nr:non-ribosomal peptide synthetase [Caldilineales bacterium]